MSLPVPAAETHLNHPKYRADIDGLRAIAVLSVIGFHAFPDWIQGGFIGVDVFFVISGFLISSIILGNLNKGSFSFLEFYSRRINRIFPALLLVLISSFVVGWVALFDVEFKQLGKHIAGGAGFVSNFILWNESSYFDNAADTKPLLHLWSLGIEEQFYIFWPLLLWVAWKLRFNMLAIIVSVAAISFFLNTSNVDADTVATFFSPQTRFWELMVGSCLAYIKLYKHNITTDFVHKADVWLGKITSGNSLVATGTLLRNAQSLFGAALIIAGIIFIKKVYAFPGWWAVLPTFGAAFIIAAGPHAWINHAILSRRIMVWFGLISYPLYLWHWTLLSLARIVGGGTPASLIRIAAVVISIGLAWLTYRLIEKPFRFGKHGKAKTISLLLLMAVVGYVGYNCSERNGYPFRFISKSYDFLKTGNDGWDGGVSINDCGLSEENKKLFNVCKRDSRQVSKYALFGDSKAMAIYGGLVRTSKENGRWLFIGGPIKQNGRWFGAPVIISNRKIYEIHQPFSEIAVTAIAENKTIEKVVMVVATRNLFKLNIHALMEDLPGSIYYEAAYEGLENTINLLITSGKKVVIVVDNPTLPNPEDCLQRTTGIDLINDYLPMGNPGCQLKLSRHMELTEQYRKLLNQIEKNYPDSVKIFDTTKYLCDVERGVCSPSLNGRSLYRGTDHISDYAAGLIGKDLNNFLQNY